MSFVLRTHDLCKRYKNHLVLDHVNMNIEQGDIYGFVGENGSGKTTIIRLITGLIFANGGDFELFGVSNTDPAIREARRKVGAIVESPSIYLNMSATDNLRMQCGILGINDEEKVKQTLETVGLAELYGSKKHAGDFSLGMRQRLGIAMALLGDPEFIILDEPMNGLDPAGIVSIRELILDLNRRGITFLISSHILTELSLIATKYGIISKGRLVQEISAEELGNTCSHTTFINTENKDALPSLLADLPNATAITPTDYGVRIEGDVDLNEALGRIIGAGLRILSVNTHKTGIEDYYLSLIGGGRHA